jgi:hypothetical protein
MRIGTRLISWIGERPENEKWQLIQNFPAQLECFLEQLDDLDFCLAKFHNGRFQRGQKHFSPVQTRVKLLKSFRFLTKVDQKKNNNFREIYLKCGFFGQN